MTYRISASTEKTTVAVVRDDPFDALLKIEEFEELGLTEVAVTTDSGMCLTRDQLKKLAGGHDAVAA